jgi:hypothetical protein
MTEVTWFLIDDDSMSDTLRHAAKDVYRSSGNDVSMKYFRKVFTTEARALGILKPKERPVFAYRFGNLAVGRRTT